jgi:hypothetical protein
MPRSGAMMQAIAKITALISVNAFRPLAFTHGSEAATGPKARRELFNQSGMAQRWTNRDKPGTPLGSNHDRNMVTGY